MIKPVFCSDLVSFREETRGGISYRFGDAGSDSGFRLYEIEYLTTRLLDGTRTPLEVVEELKATCGFSLSLEELEQLLVQLDSFGALEAGCIEPLKEQVQETAAASEVDSRVVDPPAVEVAEEVLEAWGPEVRRGGRRSLKGRVLVLFLGVMLFVGGALGLDAVVGEEEDGVSVRAVALKSSRIPVFFEEPVSTIRVEHERWLSFGRGGKMVALHAGLGDLVQEGDLLATLQLPQKIERRVGRLRKDVASLGQKHRRAKEKLDELVKDHRRLSQERARVREKLQDFTKAASGDPEARMNADLTRLKREGARVSKSLSWLGAQERRARAKEKSTRRRFKSATRKLGKLYAAHRGKFVTAPFEGRVQELKAEVGSELKRREPFIRLMNSSELVMEYGVEDASAYQVGGAIYLALGERELVVGSVQKRTLRGSGALLSIRLKSLKPEQFELGETTIRVVKRFEDEAFEIPKSALKGERAGEVRLMALEEGRAQERLAALVRSAGESVFITSPDGALRDNDYIITENISGRGVGEIKPGSELRVVE
ncbi:MAG: hypothetical protein VX699_06515 [Myxococcota bacterium]|nr:hypothetical protein [Myxococcota bacterium]